MDGIHDHRGVVATVRILATMAMLTLTRAITAMVTRMAVIGTTRPTRRVSWPDPPLCSPREDLFIWTGESDGWSDSLSDVGTFFER